MGKKTREEVAETAPSAPDDELKQSGADLKTAISEAIGKLNTRFIEVNPAKLRLLDLNAHFMRHEMYARLIENIQRDGQLTSTPLVWQIHDDDTQAPQLDKDGEPVYLVLSGNHRTKASIDAGLKTITVQAIDQYIPHSRRVALQLSHNAIFGEDDPAILKTLYEGIDDVEMRLYSGLDDKTLDLLDDVSLVSLSEANLQFQTVAITFLPEERDAVEEIWDDVKQSASGAKAHWLAHWRDYDKYLDSLEAASESHGVKNIATALTLVLDVFKRHVTDLSAGYLDEDGEAHSPKQSVPIETVLGDIFIPAGTAARLNKMIQQSVSRGELDNAKRWQALDALLDAWEGGQDA